MSSSEPNLRTLLASLDRPALEALGNRGLLRRAQKDLERGVLVSVVAETPQAIQVQVEFYTVTLPAAGLAQATCTCPAAATCQHILAAILFLQPQGSPGSATDPAPSAERALLDYLPDEVEAWAGKANFRAGVLLAQEQEAEIQTHPGLVIRFPALNVECHCPAGAGLEGVITSGPLKDPRPLVVAALVSLHRAHNEAWPAPATPPEALEDPQGAPRTRAEVLASTERLIHDLLRQGLARLSDTSHQRCSTLAVSAVGVQLPRLALGLRNLASECRLLVARDAHADVGRLLRELAVLHALNRALERAGARAPADLVGWHRTRYLEVGQIELVGLAAWPWRAGSGYEGLTLFLWDLANRRWNSWSDVRPQTPGAPMNAAWRYVGPGPWQGSDSPQQLARSRFRLLEARRNASGRLSSSTKSRAAIVGPARAFDLGLPVYRDWAEVEDRAERTRPLGLREPRPLDRIVLVRPAGWGPRHYDPVRQVFRWLILDGKEQVLPLELGFNDLTEPAIRTLESLPPEWPGPAIIVGHLESKPTGCVLQPYAIHRPEVPVLNLALDHLRKNAPAPAPAPSTQAADDERDWEEGTAAQAAAVDSPIHRLLLETGDALTALAEGGGTPMARQWVAGLEGLARHADQLGLQLLGESLRRLAALGAEPAPLLDAAYLLRLHEQAVGV